MSFLSKINVGPQVSSGLSDELFDKFRQFIYRQTGIYFQDNKKYLLESRIAQRMSLLGIPDFESYYQRLHSVYGKEEQTQLFNAVTINETYFYRNEPQINVIRDKVLPEIIEKKRINGQKHVRIWSAACSTGEEPYTLAMIIKDHFMSAYPDIQFEILGTDINTTVLEEARKGLYRNYAIRRVPEKQLKKHFWVNNDQYQLKPQISQMVNFKMLNLFDSAAIRRLHRFDIIICANVLIYFDENSKRRVISNLYDILQPGGYLFLGYAESLYGISQAFVPVHFTKTVAYQKESK
jgi:chemotaxis protein methyltransferase CheR